MLGDRALEIGLLDRLFGGRVAPLVSELELVARAAAVARPGVALEIGTNEEEKVETPARGSVVLADNIFVMLLRRDFFATFINGEIQKFLDNEGGNGRLKEERALLKQGLEDLQGVADHVGTQGHVAVRHQGAVVGEVGDSEAGAHQRDRENAQQQVDGSFVRCVE